jgi:hypothetical protein
MNAKDNNCLTGTGSTPHIYKMVATCVSHFEVELHDMPHPLLHFLLLPFKFEVPV